MIGRCSGTSEKKKMRKRAHTHIRKQAHIHNISERVYVVCLYKIYILIQYLILIIFWSGNLLLKRAIYRRIVYSLNCILCIALKWINVVRVI